jgi:predicted cobalt transporter CbtA
VNGRIDLSRPRSVALGSVALGILGGLLAALLLTFVGEPRIEEAINIERANAEATAVPHDGHSAAEPEIVSRTVQKGVGLFGAYALTGAAFGLLFAVVFTALRGSRPDPFRRALVAGAVLAGALTVAPWLKYPPNPPAVGDPDTLARRQILYISLICLTAVVGVAAAALSTRLRRDGWTEARRTVAVVAAVVVPLGIAMAILPGAPDPIAVPAKLLWGFRLASLSGNLLLWTVIALGFGVLAAETTHAGAEPGTEPISTRSP